MVLNNLNISIELTKYEGAKIITDPQGREGIFIPIVQNDLYRRDMRVFAGFTAWGNRDGNADGFGKTHGIKPRYGKEFSQNNREIIDRIGYIGSGKLIVPRDQQQPSQPAGPGYSPNVPSF